MYRSRRNPLSQLISYTLAQAQSMELELNSEQKIWEFKTEAGGAAFWSQSSNVAPSRRAPTE